MARPKPTLPLSMRGLARTPLLTVEREQELARRLARDNDLAAREEMVLANLRLVVVIAKRYLGRGLDIEDLIAEGNVGLIRAVERFNPELNLRLSSYAALWIKQAIRRALTKQGSAVRVPGYMHLLIGEWKRAAAALEEQFMRPATLNELSQHMGISAKVARSIKDAIHAVQCAWQSAANSDEGLTLEAMLPHEKTRAPDSIALDRDEIMLFRALLDKIAPRNAKVLRLRFGLEDEEVHTLEKIGERLGLTRERVRQIEKEGLQHLRLLSQRQHPKRCNWDMFTHGSESTESPALALSA